MTSERRSASPSSDNAAHAGGPIHATSHGHGPTGGASHAPGASPTGGASHGSHGGAPGKSLTRDDPGKSLTRDDPGKSLTRDDGQPNIDMNERGAERDGRPQAMDRRLFMQFLGFHTSAATPRMGVESLASAFTERRIAAVVYDDVNDPRGLGVLTWSENPAHFVTAVRPLLGDAARGLTLRPELTMLGRTYSTGYEQDLDW